MYHLLFLANGMKYERHAQLVLELKMLFANAISLNTCCKPHDATERNAHIALLNYVFVLLLYKMCAMPNIVADLFINSKYCVNVNTPNIHTR